MQSKAILGLSTKPLSKNIILEKIKKYSEKPKGFFHIVSLNPENLLAARQNQEFKNVLQMAQIQIIDGIGVVLAARLLGVEVGERLTGVELMQDLVIMANNQRLRVLLIGGRANLADKLAKCYGQAYPEARFYGLEGIRDIKNPANIEEERIVSIVSDFKPHLLFAAFGSPEQELWLSRHKSQFTGIVCMGVGGAFDYLGGLVPRAPRFMQKIGLEWLFRLIVEPWRWRRQLRLLKFIWLVLTDKFLRN